MARSNLHLRASQQARQARQADAARRRAMASAEVLPIEPTPQHDGRPAAVQREAIAARRAKGVEPGLWAEQQLVAAEQGEAEAARAKAERERSRANVRRILDSQVVISTPKYKVVTDGAGWPVVVRVD